ncbi:MAG: cobalt-precorrin-6A reductase [Cyanobacteria bacterium P01_A01_bin.84]
MKNLLILGGTGEASKLAIAAATIPDLDVQLSVAGCTSGAGNKPGVTRVGGFGGVSGLIDYLRDRYIDLLVDATHPFAAQISHHGYLAARELDIPRLMLVRPSWKELQKDNWLEVGNIQAAVDILSGNILSGESQRVFLTVGKKQLSKFSELQSKLQNIWFLIRLVEPLENNYTIPLGRIIFGKGPFSYEDELDLLSHYHIDTIVSKNSGGHATYSKIAAARELGIKVIMIDRPSLPIGKKVNTIEEVIQWLRKGEG